MDPQYISTSDMFLSQEDFSLPGKPPETDDQCDYIFFAIYIYTEYMDCVEYRAIPWIILSNVEYSITWKKKQQLARHIIL